MNIEILSTGDEVLTGAVTDSNAAYIAERLEENGFKVTRHNCVGDDLKKLEEAISEICKRADITIISGGLGPTSDDLTSLAISKAAGVELFVDDDALKSIDNFFKQLKRKMPQSNKKQAMLPVGAKCLNNPIGTAPGFSIKVDQCIIYCLPGVPKEMYQMLKNHVLPDIIKQQHDNATINQLKIFHSFGMPESEVSEKLNAFNELFPEIKLGFRANFPQIQIKLNIRHTNRSYINTILNQASQWIYAQIGDVIFSDKGLSMETVVSNLLIEKKATLAVAESCTGGLISHKLTNISGSSTYFLAGATTYSNESKIALLDVSPETLKQHGAVDVNTAKEMASGIKKRMNATYGLATTGIAGPTGGTCEKPVGTICIGLATPESTMGRKFQLNFHDRLMNKKIFAMIALDALRRKLL